MTYDMIYDMICYDICDIYDICYDMMI